MDVRGSIPLVSTIVMSTRPRSGGASVGPGARTTGHVLGARLAENPRSAEVVGAQDIGRHVSGASESSPSQMIRRPWHPGVRTRPQSRAGSYEPATGAARLAAAAAPRAASASPSTGAMPWSCRNTT